MSLMVSPVIIKRLYLGGICLGFVVKDGTQNDMCLMRLDCVIDIIQNSIAQPNQEDM